jgi:dynein light intermediate chain 2
MESAPSSEEVTAPAAEEEPTEKLELMDFIQKSVQSAVDTPSSADAELIFVGPKNSGKSTLVQAFLQKDEPPKPSTPLEYRFARHTVGTRPAVVANVWELGGGVSSTSHTTALLKTVMLPELLPHSVVAIVLDLSEPESALQALLTWLTELRARVEEMQQELALSAEGSALAAAARKASEKAWAEHPDAALSAAEPVQPVGVPIVIFAHKWDVFQQANPETEQQKVMCRTLRFFAHQAGASLICTKHKDNSSKYLLRNLLSHHVFGNVKVDIEQMQLSHMKPLFIAASADSFKAIGNPPSVQGCLSDAPADKWKAVFESVYPPRQAKREAQADLTMVEAEQFAEEAIDELRKQKREELVKMRKAAEFEAKMASEMAYTPQAQAA